MAYPQLQLQRFSLAIHHQAAGETASTSHVRPGAISAPPDIYLRLTPFARTDVGYGRGQYTIVSNPSEAKLLTVEIYFERTHGLIIRRFQLHR